MTGLYIAAGGALVVIVVIVAAWIIGRRAGLQAKRIEDLEGYAATMEGMYNEADIGTDTGVIRDLMRTRAENKR